MNIRTCFYLLLIVLFHSCKSSQEVQTIQSNPLQLYEAKYNYWTSGIKGGGMGTEFYIKVISNSNQVGIDSLIIGNTTLKTISKSNGMNNYSDIGGVLYSVGDTIFIRASARDHLDIGSNNHLLFYSNNKKEVLQLNSLKEEKHVNHQ